MRSIIEAGLTLETEIILNYEVAMGNPPAILTAVLAGVSCHVESSIPRGIVTLCVLTHPRGERVCEYEFNEELMFRVIERAVHEDCSHLAEFQTLQRFGEYVSPHGVCRAVFEVDFVGVIFVLDKVVFCFDVLGTVGARDAAVLF
jgi:hypothetical protein